MTFAGVPNSFINGTTADAPSVNANFDAVTTGLNNADAGQVVTGTFPIGRGGTGATTAPAALAALLAGSTIPGANGGFAVLLQTINASSSATIDFTAGIDGTYKKYLVLIHDMLPATDNVYLAMRVGTGAGPTWHSGVSDYSYGYRFQGTAGGADGGSGAALDNEATTIHLTRPINGIDISGGLLGEIWISNPAGAALVKPINYQIGYNRTGAAGAGAITGSGIYGATTAITGLRFLVSTGNIASGTFELWGAN